MMRAAKSLSWFSTRLDEAKGGCLWAGAEIKMAHGQEDRNPVVLGRIGRDPSKPTVCFYGAAADGWAACCHRALSLQPSKRPSYVSSLTLARVGEGNEHCLSCSSTGHYDVQPAMERDWKTDPFELHSIDGYFYARGASDNKVSTSTEPVPSEGSECPVAGAQWLVCPSASITSQTPLLPTLPSNTKRAGITATCTPGCVLGIKCHSYAQTPFVPRNYQLLAHTWRRGPSWRLCTR